jgi:hypothetical protein
LSREDFPELTRPKTAISKRGGLQSLHDLVERGPELHQPPAGDDPLQEGEAVGVGGGRLQAGQPLRQVAAEALTQVGRDAVDEAVEFLLDLDHRRRAGLVHRSVAAQPVWAYLGDGDVQKRHAALQTPAQAGPSHVQGDAGFLQAREHPRPKAAEVVPDHLGLGG